MGPELLHESGFACCQTRNSMCFFQTQLQICANVPFIPMRLKEVTPSLVIPILSMNDILRLTLPQSAMVLRHNWPNQTKGKCAHIILGATLLQPCWGQKGILLVTNTSCKVFKHLKDNQPQRKSILRIEDRKDNKNQAL